MGTERTSTAIRAVSYARQSKAREDESAASPQAQRQAAELAIASRGWRHVGHFEDVGASGFDPKASRPGLDALLAKVAAGEVDRVVVYKLDRLTRRGVVEAVTLVNLLNEGGAALISVEEPFFDLSSQMGMGIFGLFAAMASQESSNISLRTRATKALLRRRGSFAGGQRPFGYRLAHEHRDGLTITTLEPVEEEAAVVRDVANRILAGASVVSEAKRLNSAGITTATGAEWATSTLSRLLHSPVIAGYSVERRPGTNGKGYEQVIIRDEVGEPIPAWPALVEPPDWHRLQIALATRVGGRRLDREPTLLGGSDLIHCAQCGSRMGGDRRKDGGGSYRCMKHRRGSAKCDGAAVSIRHLDHYVTTLAWDLAGDLDSANVADAGRLQAIADRLGERTADPATVAEIRAAEALRRDAENALAQLDDDRAAGAFLGATGTERYLRQAQALSTRLDAAEANLTRLQTPLEDDNLLALLDMLAALRGEGGSMDWEGPDSPWSQWTVTQRREFLSLFIDDVQVAKAIGHGGGDKVKWAPGDRIRVRRVGDVPF